MVKAEAPRSAEASVIDQSKLFSLARTTAQTKARLNTTCASTIVRSPMVTSSMEKKESSATASTMSGMIIGAKTSASSTVPRRCRISMPMASSVPSSVAMTVEATATISVFSAADRMSWLRGQRDVPFGREA